jgi:DNA-binding NarL/FixJ family response regulator
VAIRLLIVDDSALFRATASVLAAERGFEVLAAVADEQQALAAAADRCPDGILLDVSLSGQDGFTVAASLTKAYPRARVVLTFANVTSVPAGLFRASGAVAFLPKEDLAAADLRALFRPDNATGQKDLQV